MKRALTILLGSLLAVCTILVVITAAQAQQTITPGFSACGAEATGRDPWDGREIKGAFARRFVGPEGIWGTCQPWVPDGGDPAMPEPAPVPKNCLGRDTYEVWQVGTAECSSRPAGVFDGTTDRLRPAKHLALQLIRDDIGVTRGLLVMRCVNGVWQTEGVTCESTATPARPVGPAKPAPIVKPRDTRAPIHPAPKASAPK